MTAPSMTTARRLVVGGAALTLVSLAGGAFAPTASAGPECANSPAGRPTSCCVKVGDAPGPGPDCTSNQPAGSGGLLGDAPIVGNLPGLGGLL